MPRGVGSEGETKHRDRRKPAAGGLAARAARSWTRAVSPGVQTLALPREMSWTTSPRQLALQVCTCRTALTLRGPVRSAALSPHFIEELMGAQPGLPPRRSAPACSHDPVTMACTDAELLSEDLRLPSCRDRLIHGPWGGGGEARAQDDLEVLTLCEVETCLDMRDLVWATAGSGDDRAD
ncbi:uncharacterized protein WM277_000681 isoform 3-T5 [Molossus nigricans]